MPDAIDAAVAWLLWQQEAGVDVCVLEPGPPGTSSGGPTARASAPQAPSAAPTGPAAAQSVARAQHAGTLFAGDEVERRVADARSLARSCRTLAELETVLREYDACPLAATATRLCFADGSPEAELFLVGEAPGAAEDRLGRPFVGPSGRLLDRMLTWVGLDRSRVWITNTVFWRPPGNRPPTSAELALCLPFLERQIALVRPKVLLFLGGLAARVLLGVSEGVSRLRGRQFVYASDDLPQPVPAFVTYHPAYLLRQPIHKRYAWRDLLAATALLEDVRKG